MGRILNYFKQSYEELRKVVWPSRDTILRHTVIVIASITVAMLIIAAIDWGLSKAIELLIQRANS